MDNALDSVLLGKLLHGICNGTHETYRDVMGAKSGNITLLLWIVEILNELLTTETFAWHLSIAFRWPAVD